MPQKYRNYVSGTCSMIIAVIMIMHKVDSKVFANTTIYAARTGSYDKLFATSRLLLARHESIIGCLIVNIGKNLTPKGAFKIVHLDTLTLADDRSRIGDLKVISHKPLCVKQIYVLGGRKMDKVQHLDSLHEAENMLVKLQCLEFAKALHALVYDWMAEQENMLGPPLLSRFPRLLLLPVHSQSPMLPRTKYSWSRRWLKAAISNISITV